MFGLKFAPLSGFGSQRRHIALMQGSVGRALGALLLGLSALPAFAQTAAPAIAPRVAFPYYTAEQVLTGLYAHQLPPRARAFEASAQALVQAAQAHCQGRTSKDELQAQWQQTLQRWQALATPAVGPLVQRRSQRQIDFWPVRPNLLDKALKGSPRVLNDMARVGAPAKGFAGFEYLLAESPSAGLQGEAQKSRCAYAVLVAQGIAVEATALRTDFDALAQRTWQVDEEDANAEARLEQTRAAFAEWVNQWLGGLERLRWLQIEQPLLKAQTSGAPAAFPRRSPGGNLADNLVDWRAQWEGLRAQALLADPKAAPPQPGRAFVSIEALLYGKGQMKLAERWRQAVTTADAALSGLGATSRPADLEPSTRRLKELTVLYQQEVAAALDVPLGFSDADGD